MKPIKYARGQAVIPVVLIAVLVFAVVYFGLLVNQRNITEGADTIGNSVINSIDNPARQQAEQEWQNLEWQVASGTVVSFWVNQQKLTPNKHAVERHGADATAATNCYNSNGTFQIWQVGNDEFHMLCKESDGSIFDIILRRRTNTSREFDLTTCFRKEKGLRDALQWLSNKRATNASLPDDAIIYIDGVAP